MDARQDERMPEPLPPRRPTSPWPIGAALLGAFVALAILFRGSYTALQIMFIVAVLIGLAATWNRSKSRPASGAGAAAANKPTPRSTTTSAVPARISLPQVLTAKETADYLRVNENTVIGELQAGRLPENQIGSQWRIRREALVAWLDGAHGGNRPVL
jgi:excisionase family DNA binding protein